MVVHQSWEVLSSLTRARLLTLTRMLPHQDDEEIYMLLELALGGELFSVLREKGHFEEAQSRFYASCVASAFCYMHDLMIVYRDLKPYARARRPRPHRAQP